MHFHVLRAAVVHTAGQERGNGWATTRQLAVCVLHHWVSSANRAKVGKGG